MRSTPRLDCLCLLVVTALLLTGACVDTQTNAFAPPQLAAAVPQPMGYETPPVLRASDLLSPGLLRSSTHWVQDRVVNDGRINHYRVSMAAETVAAPGDEMVRERVHEAAAIARIQGIKQTDRYAEGLEAAATSPLEAAESMLRDPVGTVDAVPGGVEKYLRNISQTVHGGRGETEDSFAEELIGFSEIKREYAKAFGVDPYSSNPILQQELNDLSWASFAGGLPVKVALALVPGAPGMALTVLELTTDMRDMLYDESPASLQRINRERLTSMQLDNAEMNALMQNPQYSPRHETALVDALYRMRGAGNRPAYVALAATARDEAEVRFFQRTAELLAAYHEAHVPLDRIVVRHGMAWAYTWEGQVVVPLAADYLVWTKETATLARTAREYPSPDGDVAPPEMWVAGQCSPWSQRELTALRFEIHEHAFATLRRSTVSGE